MTKYFLICASKDHVNKGVEGGFAQAGHGRKDLISKPSKGDWVVFYSSKDKFENGKPLQKFIAIGKVVDEEPYQPNASGNFKPYRRDVEFKKVEETEIRPLLEHLTFIKNKKKWGFYLISGFREISKEDFNVIKRAMNKGESTKKYKMATKKLSTDFTETFTHQFAEVNGFNLHYVIAGNGDALVLLHGWPQTWYAFRHIIPELSKHFTVIVPDLRGLGDSEKHHSGYDIYTVANDIYKLVQQLGYKEIYLLGHDFGANVAYAYAASHREEVKKLIFLDVGIMDSSLEKIPLIAREGKSLWWFPFHMRELPEELVKGKEAIYLNWFYTNSTYNQSAFSEQDISEYVRCYSKPDAMKTGFKYYRNILKNIDNNNAQSKVKLKMPVLALGGDKSFGMKPYHFWSAVAENLKGDIIKNCGHHITEEQPEALLQQLLLFIES